MRYFVEYYFKEGLPYDEKMQSQRSLIHQPQSPSALSFSRAYRLTPICKSPNPLKNYERKNNMQKKFVSKKWIAFVLSLILVVGSLPINAIALELNTSIDSLTVSESLDSPEYNDDEVMGEIVEVNSLREENVKHFRLSDGSYEAVVYPYAVHRKDSNGEWQNIDNSLILQSDGTVSKYITSDSRVKFNCSLESDMDLVTLSENGYSISMALLEDRFLSKDTLNGESTQITVTNSPKNQFNGSLADIHSLTSQNNNTVVYSNIRANTDIEYELIGNAIKEKIVVNSPSADYTYRFQFKLVGLGATLEDDGTVVLYDLQDGQEKYNIPAPYMYDSNGIHSTDVTYDLDFIKDGVYILEVNADSEWINADERVFPVVIDPTISPSRVVYDTYTYSSYPDDNYGYDEELWVSNYRTSYIKITNLPTLPSGASINNARMYVSYYYYITSGSLVVSAHQVLESWSETGLKYSNAPQVSSTSLSSATLTASSSITETAPGTAYFTITDLVRDWYDGTSANNGIALKRVSGDNQSVIIKSYEANEDRPYLSINYYPTASIPDGIYQIKNVHTGQYMQVSGKATTVGTKIQQNANTFEDHQQFLIKSVGNNEYTIQPIHAMSMALCTTSANSGTAVTLASYDSNSTNQRFSISVSDAGYYVIKNKKSDYANALMVLNGSSNSGETVYQYAYNSNNLWHHWTLEFAGPESGVYAVKNSANETYMQSGATNTGFYVSYGTLTESPKSNGNRRGLFKITYRSNTQDYVIRNMTDNAVLIYPNVNYSAPLTLESRDATTGFPVSDSSVPEPNAWKITKAGANSYYVWYQDSGGTKYYLTIPSINHLSLTQDRTSATKWQFNAYTANQKGIDYDVKDSHIITAGTSIDLSSFASSAEYRYYSTTVGDNDPGTASFSVANISGTSTSVATISTSGVLNTTAQKCGVVRVTVTFSKGISISTNFYVSPLSGEFFFLQNVQSSGGIDIGYIDGNSSGATKKVLTYDDTQLWQRIPSQWSGYYYIKNVGTGMYLSSPTSTAVGTALSMVSTITGDLQAWQFTSTPSGAWKIRSRNDAVAGRNLYLNIKSSSNNTLVQDTYVQNSSYLDEFNVVLIGNDVVYNRTLTWPTAIDPSNLLSDLIEYYDTFTLVQSDIYMDVPTARSLLENSKIMVFNGHGSPSVITIHEKPQRYIHNYEIYDPTNVTNSLDLSGTDMVFFAGCSTGGNPCDYCDEKGKHEGHFVDCPNSGSIYYNMPKSAQYAGAKVAIGWSVTTYDNHPNDWIERFIYYMNTINTDTNKLHTAYEAYIKTNREITKGNANKAVIYGTDLDFRLSD